MYSRMVFFDGEEARVRRSDRTGLVYMRAYVSIRQHTSAYVSNILAGAEV